MREWQANVDDELSKLMSYELERQKSTLIMIPSENYLSADLIRLQGSVLTNKYAEGYPGKRYYQGNEFVDAIENLAIERAKSLFGAEHANVQPHSGSQANAAAYIALLSHGDTVMGMNLSHGGHLTHGSPVNFSGKTYNFVHYGVEKDSERIDYAKVREAALACMPKMIVSGATAYPRIIDFAALRKIADEVGAYLLADISHIAGLVVSGDHPSPLPMSDVVTLTTHKTLCGPRGAIVLCKAAYAKAIDKAVFPGLQGGPLMHVIAAKAAILKFAATKPYAEYQHRIVENARALAEALVSKGIRLVSGGTDNHLLLLDVGVLGLTGKHAAVALEEAGIEANFNTIPFDPNPPRVGSGVRMGTPAITNRGMGVAEMKKIADWIPKVLHYPDDADVKSKVRVDIAALCAKFPIYENL